ncbi:prolactin-releasing peptide receptor-like [Orbicella faveolata]|uniref:prolactin-releasing peptide receptor-like n=1 Tax=Orbicella faveolata TaxID=48498 RepID=UPI0009E365F3|nr:prolactin-releasing peptide receptor-like [Orbicella faveolata]
MAEWSSSTVAQNLSTSPATDPTFAKTSPMEPAGDLESYEQAYKITLTILFSAVIFFGVLLNSIIVFTVYRWPEMRTPCNLLIVNIAVSDLAVASLVAPLRIIEVFVGWPFGNFLCEVLFPMQELFVTVSVVTHTTIALERFRAIVRPLKRRLSLRNTKLIIFAIWPACYITSSLPLAPILKVQPDDGMDLCQPQWPFELYRPIYQVYLVILFIAIPLFIQTMAYFKILKTLKTRLTPLCALPLNRKLSRAIQYRKRKRLIKTLTILVFAFQVCYIPRGVMMIVDEFAHGDLDMNSYMYAFLVTLILFYLKHVMNPIILFATSRDFRRWNFLQIFCH